MCIIFLGQTEQGGEGDDLYDNDAVYWFDCYLIIGNYLALPTDNYFKHFCLCAYEYTQWGCCCCTSES